MPRLLVHVEGETEETFVNEVLAPFLYTRGYEKVSARLLGNSRNRNRRGGIRSWSSVRSDILNHLKEDPGCRATMMVDYYALPKEGERAWPGRHIAANLPFQGKAPAIHAALHADICQELGGGFDVRRFVPYVMMHEFEGLLFSDCVRFSEGIGRPELATEFQAIRSLFSTPEEINDSPITAPSKRVESLMSNYEKPFHGTLAALSIGIDRIRSECPFFGAWLKELEEVQQS